jgi:thiol-disulfide isomerase/thioredoxin
MLKITNDMVEISKEENAIVAFTADWCNPCTKMKPQFAKASMIDKDTPYFLVDVDVIGPVWTERYNIKSIPQILELNKGELSRSIKGRTTQTILSEIKGENEE